MNKIISIKATHLLAIARKAGWEIETKGHWNLIVLPCGKTTEVWTNEASHRTIHPESVVGMALAEYLG